MSSDADARDVPSDGVPASPAAAARVADEAEAAAFADLYRAAPAPLRQGLNLEVDERDGLTVLRAPGLRTPLFNRVIGAGLTRPFDVDEAEDLQARYRRAGVACWWLHWNPHAAPADVPERLLRRGYTVPARRTWAKMLHAGPVPVPLPAGDGPGLDVGRAAPDEVEGVARAIVESFGMAPFMSGWLAALHDRPGWTLYAARDGAAVVGGACLWTGGDRAWLGMGAVLPAGRGRGGQRRLMARRIEDAVAAGCRHVVTETGEPIGDEANPSLDNMARCGFVRVAARRNLQSPE